jgi:hypothetical protein
MSYIILRGRWCHIIVLNVHAPAEDKTDDVKDNLYEEFERLVDKYPKYHMEILLGDFNAKVSTEVNFKQTIENESLHEISNDNGLYYSGRQSETKFFYYYYLLPLTHYMFRPVRAIFW